MSHMAWKKWTRRWIMKTMYLTSTDSFHPVLGILLSSYPPVTCRNPLSFLTHTESCDGLQTPWSNPWSMGDGSKWMKKMNELPLPPVCPPSDNSRACPWRVTCGIKPQLSTVVTKLLNKSCLQFPFFPINSFQGPILFFGITTQYKLIVP